MSQPTYRPYTGRDLNQNDLFNIPGMFSSSLVNSSNFNSPGILPFQRTLDSNQTISQESMSNFETKYSVQLTTLDGMGFTVSIELKCNF